MKITLQVLYFVTLQDMILFHLEVRLMQKDFDYFNLSLQLKELMTDI